MRLALLLMTAVVLTGLQGEGTLAQDSALRPQRLIIHFAGDVSTSPSSSFSFSLISPSAQSAMQNINYLRSLAVGARRLYQAKRWLTQSELAQLKRDLLSDASILDVEEDILLHKAVAPDDPRYGEQWGYFDEVAGVNAPPAWTMATGAGVIAAVLDTGIVAHSDMDANVVPGYDFISDPVVANDGDGRDADASDPGDWVAQNECYDGAEAEDSSWHGSHVAGTIAAVTNNHIGVAGVAFNARILPVRVLGKCGGYLSDIADALVWAAGAPVDGAPENLHPAKVINMSLTGEGRCGGTMQSAINMARQRNVTVVVAAGNANADVRQFLPANCKGVIAVAANNRAGARAWYSNFGRKVDVSAPGGETDVLNNGVLSIWNTGLTVPGGESYQFYQGTSMATPHVAGIAALMYEADPGATPGRIESAIKLGARPLPGDCDGGCGAGIADAARALAALNGDLPLPARGVLRLENLRGEENAWDYYRFEVPRGAIEMVVRSFGGTGDVDLYVADDVRPTPNKYDCRPFIDGNEEQCVFPNPEPGVWFIGLRGRHSYRGVSVTASWRKP
ncbi:S8 family peptidase [Hahella aquimaris]|uniref:S8 family peptidase n=1 Tax=Hahella sp. HNIBRBA332 TaxID=3015983 RepID=UPI00273AE2EE|nr:S8 family peptidase [Hahella sp. HNIBRBA332]WLQ11595.1 S8 family peptidase [Hahella sp. HNIBRBA332]